eukprot:530616-Rhodomonas_salina.2
MPRTLQGRLGSPCFDPSAFPTPNSPDCDALFVSGNILAPHARAHGMACMLCDTHMTQGV